MPNLTPYKVARVLRPHQTPQERFISANLAPPCGTFVWLRTCYDPALQSQYDELFRASGAGGDIAMEPEWVLDEAARYDFGSERREIVARLVRRIPSLGDVYWAGVEEDYEHWSAESFERGDESELVRASNRVRSGVCVVDEEDIRKRMIKVFWLGAHGECLWHNEVAPDMVENMSGAFLGGYSLEEGAGGDFFFFFFFPLFKRLELPKIIIQCLKEILT